MINQRESLRFDTQLDQVLEEFEQQWSPNSEYLQLFVSRCGPLSPPNIAELVRADIDRRYSVNVDVDLRRYFGIFPQLSEDTRLVAAIGFEDFRSRRSRSLPIHSDRWRWMPSIEDASWFSAIRDSTPTIESQSSHLNSLENAEPKIGQRFGDFQLLAVLGEGAFSTVFLAKQLGLASRYVALKVVRRTLDEPAHLARLQHTGIVPLYSLHRIGAYSALCMPYCGSATLADWIGSNDPISRNGQSLVGTVRSAQRRLVTTEAEASSDPLNEKEMDEVRVWNSSGAQPLEKLQALNARNSVIWMAQRLAAALAHAHERGVIHADLKPANILLRNDGEPALIDFNLSKNLVHDVDCAGGTLPYMSPEQLRMLCGQSTALDPSTDVYSLGIILFELIEGKRPFPVPLSQAEIDVSKALENRKQPLSMSSRSASSGLQAIIRKCLCFSTNQRYPNAQALLEDIEREIAHQSLLHAKENFWVGSLPKFMRRHPKLFSVGPIALLSIIALSTAFAIAMLGWSNFRRSDAQARLMRFQAKSQLLLAKMVDPVPHQWPQLLEDSDQLTQEFLDVEGAINSDSAARILEETLRWLGPSERTTAHRELVDFCLATTVLASSSNAESLTSQRDKITHFAKLGSALSRSNRIEMLAELLNQGPETSKPLSSKDLSETVKEKEANLINEMGSHQIGPLAYVSSSQEGENGVMTLLQARAEVKNGQARQAMQRLRSIHLQSVPKHLFWIVSGDAQLQLQQFEAAVQSYGLAIGAAPQSIAAYVQRAEAFQQIRSLRSAESDYSMAISLEPSMPSLYMRRALIRESMGNLHDAIQDMDSAIDLEPSSNRFILARARLHQQANNREEFMSDFKQGMSTTPKSVDDWVSRALAHLPRNPQKAKQDLESALKISPTASIVLQNLAHVESEYLNDLSASRSALDLILENDLENELALAGRAVLLGRLGQVEECLEDLERLAQKQSKLTASTLYQMGCAHALISSKRQGSDIQAATLLAQALRRGYGAEVLSTDKDLIALQDNPTFVALKSIAELFKATKP